MKKAEVEQLRDKFRKEAEYAEKEARSAGWNNDPEGRQYWTGYATAMRAVLVDLK